MDQEAGEHYYEYVHQFPKYKTMFDEVIEGDDHGTNISNCQRSAKSTFKEHVVYKNQCTKIEKYLTYLNKRDDGDNFIRCRFLNYVLNSEEVYNKIDSHSKLDIIEAYHNLTHLNKSDIIEAYNKLTRMKIKCIGNIGIIKDDILSQLQILYNMYDAFDNVKFERHSNVVKSCENARISSQYYGQNINECRENIKHKFCQKLIDFQNQYNELIKYVTVCSDVSNYLPDIEKDNINPITLTSVIVLITLPLAFIFLKFTPLGSWLVKQRIMKKTIIDDINKKNLKLSQNTKYVENDLSKTKYNIKYNTT
ncbi:PIR protein [Plasmodium vivax]|uniref:VIR protein n=1 Tax=Plasmodium vivax TaxID=5855 RepID=A0A565A5F2_PLAVI|nr:PIR protein [Plasmodium vivax]